MALIELEATIKYKTVMDDRQINRYTLTREWDTSLPKIVYIMLNPSIADHLKVDPTLNKCLNFAIDNGYGSLEIVNLFAFRSTDPDQLKRIENPIGSENDQFILNAVNNAETIVLAWGGENGKYMSRDKQILELIKNYKAKIKCFEDFTGKKKPQHPLTLKNGFILIDFPFDNNNEPRNATSQPEFNISSLNDEWVHLNHIELNRFAKELTIRKFTNNGFKINNSDSNLHITSPSGDVMQIQVRSIRSTTNYVLLPKTRFNAHQQDLFLLLIIFTKNEQPELFLIPASAFNKQNALFRDRDHYEIPEYGMNVSNRNMHLLRQYKIEEMMTKLL
jgi:hypothetical protein